MANIQWYAQRLRTMSPNEIAWRVRRSVVSRAGAWAGTDASGGAPHDDSSWNDRLAHFRAADMRPVLLDRDRAQRVADLHPDSAVQLLAAADLAVQKRFGYFGYPVTELPDPVDWNFDPIAGVRWPDAPSRTIDYRVADADVKWIWELNRLQHLPWLAQAWLLTGDPRYSGAAFHQLDTWLDQNPPGSGIAWRNAFEVGVRAVSIAVAVQGFRDCPELSPARFRRIVDVLVEGARRCWADRSRFSSANNHLIGELAGLAVVAILLPDLPEASEWERKAVAALTAEAQLQILPDGAGAEQALAYQMFTAELVLVVVALLFARDRRAPDGLLQAIDRSAIYLAALVGEGDPDPRYGDDDEGFALRLGPEPLRSVRDHLGVVAAVTGLPTAQRHGTRTLTSEWFAQMCSPTRVPEHADHVAGTDLQSFGASHYAPSGGLVVLSAGTRRVTMDVGPLGYLSIAAHGHADALAVTLSIDGQDVIGDPGPGSYYGNPEWRRVNRGTRVHGCVEVDDHDQSVVTGPFMWSRHAKIRVHAVDLQSGVVDAEHHGYRRLSEPVTHRRWLISPPDWDAVLVVDLLSGTGRHGVRTSWPLHPSVDMQPTSGGYALTRNGSPVAHLTAAATTDLVAEYVRGCESSQLGWWSSRLESREPSWLIGSSFTSELPVVMATVVHAVADEARVADLAVTNRHGLIDVVWHLGQTTQRASVDTTRFGCVAVSSESTQA